MIPKPFLILVAAAILASPTQAQVSPPPSQDEHAKHHPAQSGDPSTTPPPAGSAQPGMMEGMGEMMKGMHGVPPKALYPSLMELPDLPPERREDVQRAAHERMQSGTTLMGEGFDELVKAAPTNDFAAMQTANAKIREGLARFDSGLAAHRALAEGHAPREVALAWFKHEMGLAAPPSGGGASHESHSLLGLSPLHLFTMVLLIVFAVVMFAMYFFKMRRAAALFGRVEPDKGSSPPGSSPPLSGTPGPFRPPGGKPTPDGESPSPPPADKAPGPAPDGVPIEKSSTPPPAQPTKAPSASIAAASPAAPLTAKWRGQLSVESIVNETPHVKTFRLRSYGGGGGSLPFTFVPGQFLNVAFGIGGARMNRSYSISSSPNEREYVELTVKREDRGAVSRHIYDLVKVGDTIEAGGPVGTFTFTGLEAESIVLVGAGVGITPMMSVARYLSERSWSGDIYFIYGCRSEADLMFAEAIAALERQNPKLHVAITMSKPGPNWKGARGRITKEFLIQAVPNLASQRVHLCGPPSMMNGTKALLAEIGVSPDNLKTEAFGAVRPPPTAPGTSAKPAAPATGPLVTFSNNSKSARIRLDQTILELSEELDIGIQNSCRVGTCGVCKVKMTSGEVEMAVQDSLDDDEKHNGLILACQAKPKTPVTVEA